MYAKKEGDARVQMRKPYSEPRYPSTSVVQGDARPSHGETLASAFANLPWALGSWDLRIGQVVPSTSAYRLLRRHFDLITFKKRIAGKITPNQTLGETGEKRRRGGRVLGDAIERGNTHALVSGLQA